ncbi:MAG: zinc ribbon domain-containing protein [Chloroflexi bacterium]|nr:zinc ribbon domain-containing protein [Chloroflexota bacterium]
MTVVLALLIIAVVGFVVVFPLRKTRPSPKVAKTGPDDELVSRKETTFTALKELDFDYAQGNLTPEDHEELQKKYKDKALTLLKQIDQQQTRQPASRPSEEGIEAEILRLRKTARKTEPQKAGAAGTAPSSTRQPRATPSPQAKSPCPKCHSQIPVSAKYCPYCGSALKPAVCAKCSTPYTPGQRFCSQCGATLTEEKGK